MFPTTDLQRLALGAHTDDLRRRAATLGAHRSRQHVGRTGAADLADRRITIRAGRPDDACALVRLAELDSAELPPGPLLVAEIDGVVRAALSRCSGATIADPFQPTAAAVELLRIRAAQLAGNSRSRSRRLFMRLVTPLSAANRNTAKQAA
jgi:hypothetical protein